MPDEIELKLRIPPAEIPKLRRHPAIKKHLIGKPITRKLTSIYYDTPDLQLLKAAISLRVRRMSGQWFQSLKSAGSVKDGLHSRMEWEDLLSAGKPDFTKITEASLTSLFASQSLRTGLKPIFTTAVRRTEWQLTTPHGKIEMALDIGQLLINNEVKADICEVELELKQGEAQQLFVFAELLKQDIVLTTENVSKAELGYAYYLKS